ncbi:MAG: hypothetical protein BWY15_00499 [Firmicutes bacterium ADurb.Bin193]|nr:MAG: hypothetical protein BWY15_00499 [Firmicutes bacterium ADurb.Bin193]
MKKHDGDILIDIMDLINSDNKQSVRTLAQIEAEQERLCDILTEKADEDTVNLYEGACYDLGYIAGLKMGASITAALLK